MSRLFVIITTIILFLTACGGGGGGGDSGETVYDLTQYKTLDEGEKYYFTMSGEDNTGQSWTGEIGAYVWPPVNIEGENFIEEDKVIALTETSSGITWAKVWAILYNRFEVPVVMYLPFGEIVCLPETVSVIPDFARIGEAGETTSYSCNDADQTSISGVWSIEKGTYDNAYLIIDTTYLNSMNDSSYNEAEKYEFDMSGKIVSASFAIYSEEYMLSLSSE